MTHGTGHFVRAGWSSPRDGAALGVLLVAHGETCLCVAARLEGPGAEWLAGCDLIDPRAMGGRDTDLAAMVAMRPADAEAMATFGLLDGTLWPLGMAVESLSGKAHDIDAVVRGSKAAGASLGSFPVTPPDAEGALAMGYAMARPDAALVPMGPLPPSDDEVSRPAACGRGPMSRSEVMDVVAAWCAEGSRLVAASIGFAPGAMWSPRLQAHLGEPGRTGEFRRQAAALLPILAPMLAHDPGLSALVDAGRPYAAEACAALDRWLAPRRGGGFTPAKLRRLRGVPHARLGREAGRVAAAPVRSPAGEPRRHGAGARLAGPPRRHGLALGRGERAGRLAPPADSRRPRHGRA